MAEDVYASLEPLSAREKTFVAEYLIDFNGTQAAIRASYAHSNAASIACELLKRPNISAAVERAKAQRLSRTQLTQDTVLLEMSLLANSNIDHYAIDDFGNVTTVEGAPDGAMRAIQSIDRSVTIHKDGSRTYNAKIKLWDKPTPLKLMGKHVGLFPDRMEHTGKNGEPIKQVTEIRRVIVRPEEPK